ncbi:MAG: hypothetical protein LBG96_16755 [Tannerella sp.]|jgi:hypothetical protein|nr:hypothetical protein [Tannerella sp.]
MGTIKQVKEKYEKAYNAVPDTLYNTVARTKGVILALNRDQMLYGRDADGKPLRPVYLQDPYFEELAEYLSQTVLRYHNKKPDPKKLAQNYRKKKIGLEQKHNSFRRFAWMQLFPEKDSETPNLIVTGPFQGKMFIQVSHDSYTLGSSYAEASDISAKYHGRVFGLALRSKEFYYYNWIRPALELLYRG